MFSSAKNCRNSSLCFFTSSAVASCHGQTAPGQSGGQFFSKACERLREFIVVVVIEGNPSLAECIPQRAKHAHRSLASSSGQQREGFMFDDHDDIDIDDLAHRAFRGDRDAFEQLYKLSCAAGSSAGPLVETPTQRLSCVRDTGSNASARRARMTRKRGPTIRGCSWSREVSGSIT